MSALNLRRFARVDVLRRLSPELLRSFLRRHGGRQVVEAVRLEAEPLDLEALARVLGQPREGFPADLADALYRISEVAADPEASEALRAAACAAGLWSSQAEPATPDDLALAVWMLDRELVERAHAEVCVAQPRSFESFLAAPDAPAITPSANEETLRLVEADLDAWFEEHGRGHGARVFALTRGASLWMIVRQPAPWERRAYVEGERTEIKLGRPERFDVVTYDPARGELNIHAHTRGETCLYRRTFGARLFGDAERFQRTGHLTLEPLRSLGRAALSCADIEEIDRIVLREIEVIQDTPRDDRTWRGSRDLFDSFYGDPMPRGEISRAVFEVHFASSPRPRMVRVAAGNRTSYAREADDDPVKRWLVLRGFLHTRTTQSAEALSALWRVIAEGSHHEMTRAAWELRLGEAGWVATGALVAQPYAVPSLPCGLGVGFGCRRFVMYDAGVTVARCGDSPVRCDAIRLSKTETCAYRLDLKVIASRLGASLGVDGEVFPLPVSGSETFVLGAADLDGVSLSWLFASRLDEGSVLSLLDMAPRFGAGPIRGLLAPTLRELGDAARHAFDRAGVLLLGLDEGARVDEHGELIVDLWPFLLEHRGHFPSLDPTRYCRDRYDLILDPLGDRYWYAGRRLNFGRAALYPPALLHALADPARRRRSRTELHRLLPGTRVGREDWANSLANYKLQLARVLKAAGGEGSGVPEDPVLALPGDDNLGGYLLDLHPTRVLWWTRSA